MTWHTFWQLEWMRFQVGVLAALIGLTVYAWIRFLLWFWPIKKRWAQRFAHWLARRVTGT